MTSDVKKQPPTTEPEDASGETAADEPGADGKNREVGGRGGLDPTRYGDWEKAGRCIDF